MLRFHSRLIDPATTAGVPITAAAVRYVIEDGTPEEKLCWVDETLFVTHLMTTLSTPGFTAVVHFGEPHIYPDRRSRRRCYARRSDRNARATAAAQVAPATPMIVNAERARLKSCPFNTSTYLELI